MSVLNQSEEASSPTSPASGRWKSYFKSAGMFFKDSSGVETQVASVDYVGSAVVGLLDGWNAISDTWTYASADSPTFVITIPTDGTTKYSVGMRIKLTQTTVKYFIVTAVTATTLTVYGGTDYTLVNAAITLPSFSTTKAPFGFPLDANKWDVIITNASNASQPTPTQNTWYNIGTTSSQITVPIGLWDLSFDVIGQAASNAAQTQNNFFVALSTSSSSVSNNNLRGYLSLTGASASLVISSKLSAKDTILHTSKTLYYLIALSDLTTCALLQFLNTRGTMILRARFLYL